MVNNYKPDSGIPAKNLILPVWRYMALFLTVLMCASTVALAQTGIVPVNPPVNNFKIDGSLKASTVAGDWVAGPTGSGGFIFNNDGTLATNVNGKLIRDVYSSNTDIVFAEGSKFNSSPAEWTWTTGTTTDKNDINNAMYLITTDPATGDTWLIIGGDRLSTNGTSYIDFEFLQKPITRNTHDKKFTSVGTDGGRTVNDITLSVGYSGGGSVPSVTAYIWKAAAKDMGFEYVVIPAATLEGKIYAATNTLTEDVPFLAFGNSTYQPFAFVEAAINISLLFGTINPCMGINVENVVIKTKASDVETAALKDFVEPITVSLSFGTAEISYDTALCNAGTANPTYSMGSVRGGTFSSSEGLSIDPATGQINLNASTPGAYTVTYSFVTMGCERSVTTQVTIGGRPDAPIVEVSQPTCLNAAAAVTVTSPVAGLLYSFNGSDFAPYPEGGYTAAAGSEYSVVARFEAGCISNTTSGSITAQPVTPTADAGQSKVITCLTQTVKLNGSSSIENAAFAWVASDGGNIVSGANTATPTVNAAGTYTLTVTNPAGNCSATASVTVTEDNAIPVVSISRPVAQHLTCSEPVVMLGGSAKLGEEMNPEGLLYNWTGPNDFTSDKPGIEATIAGEYTLTVTNPATGCAGSASTTVVGPFYPIVNAGPDKVLTCDNPTVTLEGSSENYFDGWHRIMWEASNGGHIVSGANTFNPVVNTAGTYTMIISDSRGGCSSSDQVVVTRDATLPTVHINMHGEPYITCSVTSVLRSVETNIAGATFSWTGPKGFTSDNGTLTIEVPGDYMVTVTDPSTGCALTVLHVVPGPAYPSASAGPDKVLTCANNTVMLDGSSPILEAWQNYRWEASNGGNIVSGAFTRNPVVNAAGTYTLYFTDANSGCTVTDAVIVTSDESLPDAVATGGTLNCMTGTLQLTASSTTSGVTYSWVGPNGYTSGSQNPTVAVAGEYTVTVMHPASGCSTSRAVTVNPAGTKPTPVVTCTTIGFSYNDYSKGLISTINTSMGQVAVMGRKRNPDGSYASENHAALFDSQAPTGDDTDLYTTDWGNVLIINQDLSDQPNDNQWGGELIMDFSAIGPVTMESLKALDIDNYEGMSWVYLYDEAGNELFKTQLLNLGNNSKQTVNLGNTKGVMKMRVIFDGRNEMGELAGSGAIDDIRFCVERQEESPCDMTAENPEIINPGSEDIFFINAYPTPFDDKTTIEFRLQETESYVINLYDTKGALIRELKAGTAKAGELNRVEVNGSNLAEGFYIARLVKTSGPKTLKLILNRR